MYNVCGYDFPSVTMNQCEIRKKRDILTEKPENGMALEKRDFLPESGNVDTYEHPV